MSAALVVAVVAAGGAALLLVGPGPGGLVGEAVRARRAAGERPRRRGVSPRVAVLVAGGALAALGLGLGPRAAVLAAMSLALAAAVAALTARRRRARAAAEAAEQTVQVCELLAAELRAGRPPSLALAAAVEVWPLLAPVHRAEQLGASVPQAWQRVARTPGAGDLRLVGAAWQVTHHSGAGLAAAMQRIAALARAGQATRRVVVSELASARSTARLIAGLPVVALMIGGTTGGSPWGFLLGTAAGLACLGGGLALGLLGLWWIEAIADDVSRGLR